MPHTKLERINHVMKPNKLAKYSPRQSYPTQFIPNLLDSYLQISGTKLTCFINMRMVQAIHNKIPLFQ